MGFGWIEKAGYLLGPIIIRGFAALAFGEVGGSLLLGFAFEVSQMLSRAGEHAPAAATSRSWQAALPP